MNIPSCQNSSAPLQKTSGSSFGLPTYITVLAFLAAIFFIIKEYPYFTTSIDSSQNQQPNQPMTSQENPEVQTINQFHSPAAMRPYEVSFPVKQNPQSSPQESPSFFNGTAIINASAMESPHLNKEVCEPPTYSGGLIALEEKQQMIGYISSDDEIFEFLTFYAVLSYQTRNTVGFILASLLDEGSVQLFYNFSTVPADYSLIKLEGENAIADNRYFIGVIDKTTIYIPVFDMPFCIEPEGEKEDEDNGLPRIYSFIRIPTKNRPLDLVTASFYKTLETGKASLD